MWFRSDLVKITVLVNLLSIDFAFFSKHTHTDSLVNQIHKYNGEN